MANRFTDSFNQFGTPQNSSNIFTDFNSFRQNPYDALASKGINVPNEYRGSYQQTAAYLLQNMPQMQQNGIMQRANMLKQLFGIR